MPSAASPGPLTPLLGRWRTSGVVLDEHGAPTAQIAGTDVYELMPGGGWVVHRVDVRIGGEQVTALELIGEHDARAGTWQMHAFDGDGTRSTMQAALAGDGSWVFSGDGVQARLHAAADGASMTATWERSTPAGWVRWMVLDFTASHQPTG